MLTKGISRIQLFSLRILFCSTSIIQSVFESESNVRCQAQTIAKLAPITLKVFCAQLLTGQMNTSILTPDILPNPLTCLSTFDVIFISLNIRFLFSFSSNLSNFHSSKFIFYKCNKQQTFYKNNNNFLYQQNISKHNHFYFN